MKTSFVLWCRATADTLFFQNFFTLVILVATILVVAETYPTIKNSYGDLIAKLDFVVVALFTLEIFIKSGAHGKRPWRFLKDGWNAFDFVVVGVSIIFLFPIGGGEFVPALRTLRLLRVLRVVRAVPPLQRMVRLLFASIPFALPILVLLMLFLIIGGAMAVNFFGSIDPIHYGSFHASVVTLFAAALGEAGPVWGLRESSPIVGTGFAVFFSPIVAFIMGALLFGAILIAFRQEWETSGETSIEEPQIPEERRRWHEQKALEHQREALKHQEIAQGLSVGAPTS